MNFKTYMPEGRFLDILDFTAEIKFIGGYDKYIYMHLAKHAYRNDFCFVSQQRLAEISSSSLRTVQRCLCKLDRTGMVRVVKEGAFKKYYMTIPPVLEALAAKYGLIVPERNREISGGSGQNTAPESNASVNIAEEHDKNSRTGDNLSHINKNKSLYNNPPLSPRADSKPAHNALRRCGGAGSFSSSALDEIQKEFQKLQAVYPRHEDLREAFEVFVRSHGSLPPIGELVSAVEYEKANNPKWQRDYAPYLKNWLKSRHFEAALQFMRAETERAAAAAEPGGCVLHNTHPEPEETPAQEAIGPEQPFIETDFKACVDLWEPCRAGIAPLRAYWATLLALGILPTADAARAAQDRFRSMFDWLKAFKQAEFSKNKSPVSNTNTSCRRNQACCSAA